MKRFVFVVLLFLVVCAHPVSAQSSYGLIAGDFLEDLFNPQKRWYVEVYNNTGSSIDIYIRGEYRTTLKPGESMTYEIRLSFGYYTCFTVNARMNGYYSTRSYNYTVRYQDMCGPLPITFTRYDFPSEATEKTREIPTVTVVNASANTFEMFRDGISLGVIEPGQLKAIQATHSTLLFRSKENKFTQKEVRSQSVIIIRDSDFP